jgi:aromatic ring-opening dioxygenase catalytic subunit (LigB family)
MLPLTRSAWQDRLATLPGSPEYTPAMATAPMSLLEIRGGKYVGPYGPLANFLLDFGPALLANYQPKGILVFSAHWEE